MGWKDLNMFQKRELIRMGISRGLVRREDIIDMYNNIYRDGGELDTQKDTTFDAAVQRANYVASNYDEAKDFDMNPIVYGIRKWSKDNFDKGGLSNCTLSATQWVDPGNPYMSARNIVGNPASGYTEISSEDALPGDLLITKNPEHGTYHTMLINGYDENGKPLLTYSKGGHDTSTELVKGKPYEEYHRLDREQGGNHTEDHYLRYSSNNRFVLPELVVNKFADGGAFELQNQDLKTTSSRNPLAIYEPDVIVRNAPAREFGPAYIRGYEGKFVDRDELDEYNGGSIESMVENYENDIPIGDIWTKRAVDNYNANKDWYNIMDPSKSDLGRLSSALSHSVRNNKRDSKSLAEDAFLYNAMMRDNTAYLEHADAMRKYYGQPELGLIEESPYKPANSKDDMQYYRFRTKQNNEQYADALQDLLYRKGEQNSRHYHDSTYNEYIAGLGVDPDEGEYISNYDKWDYTPSVVGGTGEEIIELATGGNPFEIYDRKYLDDYYGIDRNTWGNPNGRNENPYYGGYLPELEVPSNIMELREQEMRENRKFIDEFKEKLPYLDDDEAEELLSYLASFSDISKDDKDFILNSLIEADEDIIGDINDMDGLKQFINDAIEDSKFTDAKVEETVKNTAPVKKEELDLRKEYNKYQKKKEAKKALNL